MAKPTQDDWDAKFFEAAHLFTPAAPIDQKMATGFDEGGKDVNPPLKLPLP